MAISPDGRNVYVVSNKAIGGERVGRGVAVLSRDRATGALIQLPGEDGCVDDDGSDGCAQGRALASARAVAISPDGRNVYVTSLTGVAVFARDGDGRLTQARGSAGCVGEAPQTDCGQVRAIAGGNDVVVSFDGQQVYVAAAVSHAIAVLSRDPASGSLSQAPGSAGCIGDAGGCAPGRGLATSLHLALSNDGRDLYAAGYFAYTGAIAILRRDPRDGTLTQSAGTKACVSGSGPRRAKCGPARGLQFPNALTVSADGRSVYASSLNNNAVVLFNRDSRTGALSQPRGRAACLSSQAPGGPPGTVITRTCAPARYLNPGALAASPGGENLYVLSSSSVTVFSRRKGSGVLRQLQGVGYCVTTFAARGCATFRGLTGPLASLAVAPNGRNLYVSSDNALAVFSWR
jgi:DNA-binding beta-propeller fold protein YncE